MDEAERIGTEAARLLDMSPRRVKPLAGGDLSPVLAMDLPSGERVIAKGGPSPETEAEMLRTLAEAGARVPKVLAVSRICLVMEALPQSGGLRGAGWLELGESLLRQHRAPGAPDDTPYGWPVDYAFGPVPIPNAGQATWTEFWAEARLRPSLPELPAPLACRVERLAAQIEEHLPPRPFPSLLHGDLWAGNVLGDQGHLSGLIDPACYYGDAEVDLAMLHLFGAPGREFAVGYGALPPGWEARRAIYQLWPALVHLRLFGAGYHGMVAGLLDRIGV
ncbi:hypothetical protein B6V72_07305 [Thioclava sp. F34-6]|uniref:fructosamine kinase family protein n=1 Tax=Thioclava sp. F34-6 TaxID=1973003 RepID=UPI000B741C6E|nr:fructosamine kinase family protein [Thioclava sp. F34-6]OWY13804.1 hypothetical protein B6V72_07305 [Thioclava sp. F34-6]